MRRIFALLLVGFGMCVTQDVGVSSGQARFTEYPTGPINAFQAACVGPAQSFLIFLKPSPTTFQCREFLPPDTTAAIILNFNGAPGDLPELAIRFETEDLSPGFPVTNHVFLNVPRKTGDTIPGAHAGQRSATHARLALCAGGGHANPLTRRWCV